MEFGMFHEFQALPGETAAQSFANCLAQVDAAEEWGLDAMWARRAALRARALGALLADDDRRDHRPAHQERMKIGTAVQVLPLCHPLRLAEEVATVDQLSRGRLIFGVGRSGFAHTYKTYGVDYGESRERFPKRWRSGSAPSPRSAWTLGKYFTYENVRLSPKSLQQPWPEIRVAAASPDTYARWPSSAIRSSSPRAPATSPSWRRW